MSKWSSLGVRSGFASELPPVAVVALNRIGFGPRPGDLEAFDALSGDEPREKLAAYVEQQLDPNGIDDSECVMRLENAGFETVDKDQVALWNDHILNNPYPEGDDRRWLWYTQPVREAAAAAMMRAVYSRRQLAEVLTDFWHNHFNVYGYVETVAPLFAAYDRDVIRPNVLGNFRTLLESVSRHPVMLYYLDNVSSSDAGPNENFARELFELHTLGSENYLGVRDPHTVDGFARGLSAGYVDNDVYEAARCFTGWRVDADLGEYEDDVGVSGEFLYYHPWHDRFNKIVLGRYIPYNQPALADGLQVLDLLAEHPGTARHIARKLCRRLIADDPPESVVQAAAQVFHEQRAAPDQLKQVVRAIVLSPEFASTWGLKVKRPFNFTVSMLRALGAEVNRFNEDLTWLYSRMGQPLFGRRSPNGYPEQSAAWINSMSLLYRWNLAVAVIENWMNEDDRRDIHVDLFAHIPETLHRAAELADFWIERLLGRKMSAAGRRAVIELLSQDFAPEAELPREHLEAWLPGMVELICMSPEFQVQ